MTSLQCPWLSNELFQRKPSLERLHDLFCGNVVFFCEAQHFKQSLLFFLGDVGRGHVSCLARDNFGAAVDVFKAHVMPEGFGVGDQSFRTFGRDGLALFVVPYISLGASHCFSKCGLGDFQALSDGFNRAHALNTRGASAISQQRR